MRLDTNIIRAASMDAGNRSKAAAGRTKWNLDDYNAAVQEHNRLLVIWEAQR